MLSDPERLVSAIHDRSQVYGFSHNFYRYPARFSPIFAREVIRTFSEPGDLILDPFAGGGTTLVEASTLGRRSVGIDISSLATFISAVKTRPLSQANIDYINDWISSIDNLVIGDVRMQDSIWTESGYLRNLNSNNTWRIRNQIEILLRSMELIEVDPIVDFLRCALLRTGQWALDGRKKIPSVSEFRKQFKQNIIEMLVGIKSFENASERFPNREYPIILNRSVIGLEKEPRLEARTPQLILMSPPYPGVHVLYHRWQILGRKETPAPFWIANQLDGNGAAHYTFGSRNAQVHNKYFEEMLKVFSTLNRVADEATIIVQLVAFSEPRSQLQRYLRMMEEAGLEEVFLTNKRTHKRIWRKVPNRKWHATLKGKTPSSREVVLIHKKREAV